MAAVCGLECQLISRPSPRVQGEIAPGDRDLVPKPSPPPSADFLQQLREYTQWRLQVKGAEAEPAARTHLGAKRSGGSAASRCS